MLAWLEDGNTDGPSLMIFSKSEATCWPCLPAMLGVCYMLNRPRAGGREARKGEIQEDPTKTCKGRGKGEWAFARCRVAV